MTVLIYLPGPLIGAILASGEFAMLSLRLLVLADAVEKVLDEGHEH